VRLSGNGSVAGTRTIAVGVEPYPLALAAAPGGKAVVTGYTRPDGDNNPYAFALRLTPAGEADAGWAQGGAWISSARGRADGVGVGGDGTTVLTGATSDDKLTVTRLQGDGTAGGGSGGGGGGSGSPGGGEGAGGPSTKPLVVGRPVMRRGLLLVRVRCTAGAACRGKASLLPRRGKGKAWTTKRFTVASGKAKRLRLRPKRRVRTARLRVTTSAPQKWSRTLAVRLR
jgi:hypothetical protein